MPDDNCPILVGVGQTIQRKPDDLAKAKGPIDLMVDATRAAEDDAGAKLLAEADRLRVIRFLAGGHKAPADLLSERLGIAPTDAQVSGTGGNSPQAQINETAEAIAEGKSAVAIIAGCECLGSFRSALTQGIIPEWIARDGAEVGTSPVEYEGTADYEVAYEFQRPVNVYPIFETALRANYGHTVLEHQQAVATMFARFTKIAAENPYAWFRDTRTADEIATVSEKNRYIGFPYTKLMNAIITVDQAATVIMTSVAKARALGISEDEWVYLQGCADSYDHWYVTERENLHSSPAIRLNAEESFRMAGCTADDVGHFDLYSCFPSAVQIACDEIGVAHDDPRGHTVTGGLPYHGGPSNSYVMNSVAAMVERLRQHPGDRGLCTAVGWFLTKHSIGLYGTAPVEGPWKRTPQSEVQSRVDALPKAEVELNPSGAGKVESYTVIHEHNGPKKAVVVGRDSKNRRFLATTANTPEILTNMTEEEYVGRTCTVRQDGDVNVVDFD